MIVVVVVQFKSNGL